METISASSWPIKVAGDGRVTIVTRFANFIKTLNRTEITMMPCLYAPTFIG